MNKLLELLDGAAEAAVEVAHISQNEKTKSHLEYAIALLREAWIEESGQHAKDTEQVIEDVDYGIKLVQAAFGRI